MKNKNKWGRDPRQDKLFIIIRLRVQHISPSRCVSVCCWKEMVAGMFEKKNWQKMGWAEAVRENWSVAMKNFPNTTQSSSPRGEFLLRYRLTAILGELTERGRGLRVMGICAPMELPYCTLTPPSTPPPSTITTNSPRPISVPFKGGDTASGFEQY